MAALIAWTLLITSIIAVSAAVTFCGYTHSKLKLFSKLIADIKLNQDLSEDNHNQLTQSMTHMGQRIVETESKVSYLVEKAEQATNTSNGRTGHYHQARRIVDLGGDETNLVEDCGLTRIEAQMIRNLQAKKNNKTTTVVSE